jgi:hypothetical protein
VAGNAIARAGEVFALGDEGVVVGLRCAGRAVEAGQQHEYR